MDRLSIKRHTVDCLRHFKLRIIFSSFKCHPLLINQWTNNMICQCIYSSSMPSVALSLNVSNFGYCDNLWSHRRLNKKVLRRRTNDPLCNPTLGKISPSFSNSLNFNKWSPSTDRRWPSWVASELYFSCILHFISGHLSCKTNIKVC